MHFCQNTIQEALTWSLCILLVIIHLSLSNLLTFVVSLMFSEELIEITSLDLSIEFFFNLVFLLTIRVSNGIMTSCVWRSTCWISKNCCSETAKGYQLVERYNVKSWLIYFINASKNSRQFSIRIGLQGRNELKMYTNLEKKFAYVKVDVFRLSLDQTMITPLTGNLVISIQLDYLATL